MIRPFTYTASTTNLPRGLIGGILVLLCFAALILTFGPGGAGAAAIMNAGDPLVAALESPHAYGGQTWVSGFVNLVGLAGLIASFFSIIFAYSRQTFALSRAGYLPRLLSLTSQHKSPVPALVIPGIIGFLLSLTGQGDLLILVTVFGATISYVLMMASHIALRIGGTVARRVDFRVIGSSNRNLKELVDQGKFRSDLYYRLNVFPITVPPLRLRREDIPILIEHHLKRLNAQYGDTKSLFPQGLDCLLEYPWPGNIRELKNLIERLWLASNSNLITVTAADLEGGKAPIGEERPRLSQPATCSQGTLKQALEHLERQLLAEARTRCKTTYEIAAYLGISQPSVVRKLKRYGIEFREST